MADGSVAGGARPPGGWQQGIQPQEPHAPRTIESILAEAKHPARHPADDAENMHANHKVHPLSHKILWGAGIAAAAIIALPYIGQSTQWFGSNGPNVALNAFTACSGQVATGYLAPMLNNIVGMLPYGFALSGGGWAPVVASLVISLGGRALAGFLEREEDKHPGAFRWSKVVRTVATCTSLLISLPGILTGISMGLDFLAQLGKSYSGLAPASGTALMHTLGENHEALKQVSDWSIKNLGSVGGRFMQTPGSQGFGSTAFLLSHTVSCGLPLLNIGLGQAASKIVTAPKRFVDRVSEQAGNALDIENHFHNR